MAASWTKKTYDAVKNWWDHFPPRLFAGQDATDATKIALAQVNPADGSVQSKLVSGSTTTVTQATAANLNATVVGTAGAELSRRGAERANLFMSAGDTAIAAGGAQVDVTGWVPIGEYRFAAAGLRNTGGVNAITHVRVDYSPDNGATVYLGQATAFSIAAGTGIPVALDATTSSLPYSSGAAAAMAFTHVRINCASAAGTNARAHVVGMR